MTESRKKAVATIAIIRSGWKMVSFFSSSNLFLMSQKNGAITVGQTGA